MKPAPQTQKTRLAALWASVTAYFVHVMAEANAMANHLRVQVAHAIGIDRMRNDTGANAVVVGLVELLVGFIVLVLCILIAFLILPLVNNASNTLKNGSNTTEEQKSVLPLIGLILIFAILIMALAFMFAGFKNIINAFK